MCPCAFPPPAGDADTAFSAGITIPIIPGIMPIQNYLSFRRMTNLCGTHIPPNILADLERIQVRSRQSR